MRMHGCLEETYLINRELTWLPISLIHWIFNPSSTIDYDFDCNFTGSDH